MSLTTDRNDPGLRKHRPDGQQESYLILSEEERAKGFVRPVRRAYRHAACGAVTTMGQALCETYARDPKFYGGTFCCNCGKHFPLETAAGWQFFWEPDGDPVGSNAEEAAAFFAERDNGITKGRVAADVAELLHAMESEGQPPRAGLRCPKCGGQMAHYRLYGYRCIRGCQ